MGFAASRLVLPLVVAGVAFVLAACGEGGDKATPTQSASPVATAGGTVEPSVGPSASPPSGEAAVALQVVRATLDKINAGDVDGAYANLSTDARKDVSLPDAKRIIGGLHTAGVGLTVTIDKVGTATVNGDVAEIELTVRVKVGEVNVPVQDAASLVKENGQWKLADHFLQAALTAVGLFRPKAGVRALDAKGCATGDPMEGVYAPARLKILDSCITVKGVVANDIDHGLDGDGDITFGLILSDADKRLINHFNVTNHAGNLHIEIVPFDQRRVHAPQPGDTITVTGPWVTDLVHGHNEIHPAFVIAKE